MSGPRISIQDRLASVRAAYENIVHEAWIDYENKRVEAERARAGLVDAQIAARRMAKAADNATRPRHLLPGERGKP